MFMTLDILIKNGALFTQYNFRGDVKIDILLSSPIYKTKRLN